MAAVIFELTIENGLDNEIISVEPYENVGRAKKAALNFIEGEELRWPDWAEWKSIGRGHWATNTGTHLFRIVKRKVK